MVTGAAGHGFALRLSRRSIGGRGALGTGVASRAREAVGGSARRKACQECRLKQPKSYPGLRQVTAGPKGGEALSLNEPLCSQDKTQSRRHSRAVVFNRENRPLCVSGKLSFPGKEVKHTPVSSHGKKKDKQTDLLQKSCSARRSKRRRSRTLSVGTKEGLRFAAAFRVTLTSGTTKPLHIT